KHSNEIDEIGLNVEAVKSAGGDERKEVCGGPCVVVGAEEEPGLPADSDGSQGAFGGVVLQAQPAVVEEAPGGVALAHGVPERRGDRPSHSTDALEDALGPCEEVVEYRARGPLALGVSFLRRQIGPSLFELEEGAHAQQRLARGLVLGGDGSLPEFSS